MSFDMFSCKQNNEMDPNYIYPMPYIDPMMYANPYSMNGVPCTGYQMNPNMTMGSYITYMNPYMNNPAMGQNPMEDSESNFEDMEDNMYMQNQMQGMPGGMMPGMPCMPGGMMPGMPGGMMPMMPGMPCMPGGMMPMMPGGMMFPYMMMPSMPQIHMEEFDEEEM